MRFSSSFVRRVRYSTIHGDETMDTIEISDCRTNIRKQGRTCIAAWVLMASVVWCWAACHASANERAVAIDSKLDRGIDADAGTMLPVFVRMDDQLFRTGGDYEAFTREHEDDKRNELRQLVLQTFRDKQRRSWEKVGGLVDELTQEEEIRQGERFWIVNGFACDASPAACRRLAESEAVAFVYLQRGPVRQHKMPVRRMGIRRPGPSAQQQKQVYEHVLADWRDDSNEPFSADGLEIPWNLKRIQADAAWRDEKITGKGVVIALCDSGLMVAPPLVRALWRNPKEEINGQDDDNNGYVDDIFGYDFAARSFYSLGDGPLITHGSMCGGIMAGRPSSKKLITGVAPPG